MTVARRRLLPPLVLGGVLLIAVVPLLAAATSGRDDRSILDVYLTALGYVGAIVAAGAFFVGLEVHRYRRFRELAGPARPSTADRSEPDQPVGSERA